MASWTGLIWHVLGGVDLTQRFKAEWTGLCVVDGFGHGAARRLGIVVRGSEQSAVFEAGSGYRLIMRYQ